ncbi:50S ribosomal protein P1 [Vulcanisaeta souniana]|uniref:Large ribosomal subunit protein P1 n=1 Tax=Vulcanisaeta souniana JCM 11219 TaxID=1293586 RepID=A0A830EN17_9CREN|nr:50S ribosomal protein P1 [Vulcanisaeta souniana]BDR93117.1 50S ribosomal protein P1 [Vulcanisaeta souniana JCM 11219]GGI86889.1 50S ribosomal protein P1 [Vulcanisaeta souniana JCM 11219]
MEYVYAALLLHYGKQPISEENVVKVLQAAGIQVDEVRVKALVAALKEVNIDEAIKAAVAMPVAAASAATSGSAAAGGEQKAETKAEEKKAEEKKEGPSEEEIAAGLSSLFG